MDIFREDNFNPHFKDEEMKWLWLVTFLNWFDLFVLNLDIDSEVLASSPNVFQRIWLLFIEEREKIILLLPILKMHTKNTSITNTRANYKQSIGCFFSHSLFLFFLRKGIGIHTKLSIVVFNSKGIVEGTSHSLKIMTNYAIFVLPN